MIHNKKIVVVLPAYNAAKTLEATYNEIPHEIVDEVILVDDASSDNTVEVAKKLKVDTFVHLKNKGYGGNQKTCYREALKRGLMWWSCFILIISIHPNYSLLWFPWWLWENSILS